ncbi:MAG: HAMP domain-containing histidine kinase [Porticoccaceae bacterium]|nr:HAMP domain-containing histidine kinase [Porticoccaceae bacterium]
MAIWAGYVLLVGIAAGLIEDQYESRFSEIGVSERYGPLANYIIRRYEQGIDISRREFRQVREGFENDGANDDRLVIRDMQRDRVIFGDREREESANIIDFRITGESGTTYMANVGIPPNRNPLPVLTTPTAIATAFATSLLYSWFFTLILTRPVSRLKEHVQSLGRGSLDQRLEGKLMKRRDEIGDLATSIDEMSSYIQELLNSKQRLLFDVSHELRAPLARMHVAAGIARAEAESAGANTAMHDRFEQEIDALNALISELILLTKTESDTVERESVSLPEQLQAVIDDMQFGSVDREIKTQIGIEADQVEVSVPLLGRVVKNLIENALKYSQDEVLVSLSDSETDWVICVEDRGEGIPEDQLEAMTQPFTRLQSESVEGFGLGLSIAHRAAEAMGGSLTLSNREGGGLCACLLIPKA